MDEKDSTLNLTKTLEENLEYYRSQKNHNPKSCAIRSVWATFKWDFFYVLIIGLCSELISIGNMFLTSVFIMWLKDSSKGVWIGFVVAVSLATILSIALILRHQFFFLAMNAGTKIRKGLTGIIFQK